MQKKYLGMALLWPKDSSNPIRNAAAIFSCCSSIFAASRIPLACSFESKLHLDLKCNQAADENPEYKAILAMRDWNFYVYNGDMAARNLWRIS